VAKFGLSDSMIQHMSILFNTEVENPPGALKRDMLEQEGSNPTTPFQPDSGDPFVRNQW
jgi:hypothetical protein